MIDFAVRPATLIGQTPPPSRNIAGAPAKSWRVTTSPKTRAGLARVTEMEAPGGGSGAFASTHVENSVDEASLSNKRTPWLHGLTTRQHRDLVPCSKAHARPRDHRSRLVDVAIVPMVKIIWSTQPVVVELAGRSGRDHQGLVFCADRVRRVATAVDDAKDSSSKIIIWR